jgi:hypothetical protein
MNTFHQYYQVVDQVPQTSSSYDEEKRRRRDSLNLDCVLLRSKGWMEWIRQVYRTGDLH